jgi:large subunit ribosomal protein L17
MRHNVKKKKLNRDVDHRTSLKRNLIISILLNKSIETSVTKAKWVRPFIEKLITLAKIKNFHNISLASKVIDNKEAVRVLFDKIGPEMSNRAGGYTSIKKTGKIRKGDSSESAVIKLVENKES